MSRCDHLQAELQSPEARSQVLQRLRGCSMTEEERQAFEARLAEVVLAERARVRARLSNMANPRKLAYWFGVPGGGFPRIYGVLFLAGLGYGAYWLSRFITRRS